MSNPFSQSPKALSLGQILKTIGQESHPPRATVAVQQIPWSDPAFSERLLEVHLDTETHMASRKPETIEQHLEWLVGQLRQSGRKPEETHILDVGCGPGFYMHRLAEMGYQTTGFDFSPAPLNWAIEMAQERGLDCRFFPWDLTNLPENLAELTGPVDAITFWFGEINSFDLPTVAQFLPRLAECLRPGGKLYLEYQPADIFVTEDETQWSWQDSSVFCDRPHLWLEEFGWDEAAATEVHVHWIIEQDSGKLHRYTQYHHRWSEAQLTDLLADAGLVDPVFHPPLTAVSEEFEFPVLVTRKKAD